MPSEPPIYDLAPLSGAGSVPPSEPERTSGGHFDPTPDLPTIDLGLLARRMLAFWWLILGLTFLGAAGAYAYAKTTKKIYSSVATVSVPQVTAPLIVSGSDPNAGGYDLRSLEVLKTIEQSIISQNQLLRVIKTNKLDEDAEYLSLKPGQAQPTESQLINKLGANITVVLRRGTRLIDITVEDTSPTRACRLAESVVEEYLASTREFSSNRMKSDSAELKAGATRLREAINVSSKAVQDFREAHPDLTFGKNNELAQGRLKELNEKLLTTSTERNKLEGIQKAIQSLGPNPNLETVIKVQGVGELTGIVALKSQLAQAEAYFAQVQSRYLPKHPTYVEAEQGVIATKKEISLATGKIVMAVSSQIEATREAEKGLAAEIKVEAAKGLEYEKALSSYQALLAAQEGDRTMYETVLRRLKEVETQSTSSNTQAEWSDRPVVNNQATKPKKMIIVAIGLILGAGLGIGLTLLITMLRQQLTEVDEVERTLRLPALAVIPKLPGGPLREQLLGTPAIDALCAEAFRALRAGLTFTGKGTSTRSYLFAGMASESGTSFTAMNFAASLASQGFRTLLIDGNLHRPSLDDVFFGQPNAAGLNSYLEGVPGVGKACRPTHQSELYLLSAGQPSSVKDPSELLSSKKMGLLIQDAQQWFHRIVIDAPSLSESSDALLMARHADALVLVIKSGAITKATAQSLMKRLAFANLKAVGFVFNNSTLAAGGTWMPATARVHIRPQAQLALR
jgi:polysaccharide biosynthesis transport protein